MLSDFSFYQVMLENWLEKARMVEVDFDFYLEVILFLGVDVLAGVELIDQGPPEFGGVAGFVGKLGEDLVADEDVLVGNHVLEKNSVFFDGNFSSLLLIVLFLECCFVLGLEFLAHSDLALGFDFENLLEGA